MMKHDIVPMPNEEEKKIAINSVLDAAGLPKQSLWALLADAKKLPLSVLFFGVGDCLFLAVLISFVCVVPAAAVVASEQTKFLPLLFMLSPVFYTALYLLTEWKEAMTGTLEWKKTCKLSFRSLVALRMLVFGGIATMLCVPQGLLLWHLSGMQTPLLWILSVSFASLFLYAALTLAFLSRRVYLPAIIWTLCGIVLFCWNGANSYLLQVPTVVFALIAAASLIAVYYEIKHFILYPKERSISYAVR